jgi:hypothetical protein
MTYYTPDETRILKLSATLRAYTKAFNEIDDRMEYVGMTKKAFAEIAKKLTAELIRIEKEY